MPSGRWRGCWRDTAKRKQSITNEGRGYDRKTDAKEAAQEQEVKARRRAAAEAGTASAKMLWRDLWEIYNTRPKRAKAVSGTTFVQSENVKRYVMPRWGDTPINKISHVAVQNWIDEDIDILGRKPNYVRTVYTPFRASINYAVIKLKILDASPCVGIELPKAPKRQKKTHTTTDEAAKLGKKLHPRYKRMLEFELETGLRPNELCGLHAVNVDRKRRRITVADVYVSNKKVIRAYTKNGEEREVPLTQRALQLVDEALEGRDLAAGCGVPHANGTKCKSAIVFLSPRGEVAKPRNYFYAINRASGRAKMPKRGAYDARRGFSTRAVENGVDPFTLQAILGHATLDQTAEYVQLTDTALNAFTARMGDPVELRAVKDELAAMGHEEVRGADHGADVQGTTVDESGNDSHSNTG
ncbi:tyrosine-type recombinase/integrase [Amycolatopsis roodepoortensis]|uniref:Integrase n=2 Tax=Amycolatopsis TaxID=1813 RepID=A0ABR9L2Q1_9PSEU|nr:tyrosine-type recombinase/integrase [Amycolatopsis roodepoortensis]MBE1575018.1 integrase [Amycolatopsis roodepoortensis]